MVTKAEAFSFDKTIGTVFSYKFDVGGAEVIIPSEIDGVEVKGIGYRTFISKAITSLVIPNTIIYWVGAAESTQVTSLVLPKSITSIESDVFNSSQLTKLTLSNSLITIATHAFSANKLTYVLIPEGVTTIKSYAFADNTIQAMASIPASVNQIYVHAFTGNQIRGVYLSNNCSAYGYLMRMYKFIAIRSKIIRKV